MNSLAQEPSYFAPTLILLLFGLIRLEEITIQKSLTFIDHFKSNKVIWLGFFYAIITSFSATNIFISPFIVLYFYRKRFFKYVPVLSIGLICFYAIFRFISPDNFIRFELILGTIFSFDPHAVYEADQSGSARIAPYFFYLNDIDFSKISFWMGYGIDYAANYMSYELRGFEEGSESGIGGIINFIYDYGFIWFLVTLSFFKMNVFKSFLSFEFLIWIVIFSVQSFNVSIFWSFFLIMFAINDFEKRAEEFLIKERIIVS